MDERAWSVLSGHVAGCSEHGKNFGLDVLVIFLLSHKVLASQKGLA
jgi:hypothetical protein